MDNFKHLTAEEISLVRRGYAVDGTLTNPAKAAEVHALWMEREAITNKWDGFTVLGA